MDSITIIRRLHQHRNWSNQGLLSAASQLTDDQLHRPFPMGQGSIYRSMTHLYAAEYVWLEALSGNEDPVVPGDVRGHLPGNQQGDASIRTFADLTQRWSELDQRWATYLAGLSPECLTEMVWKVSSLSGERQSTRRSDILLHVCTHAQYTTAQVMNMLRHVGVQTLPDPMLISLARQE